MNLIRLVVWAYIILGAIIGIIIGFTGGILWNDDDTPATDDTRYEVTPRIRAYYDTLRASHKPPPKYWVRGSAGTDYCRNLSNWFISAQQKISKRQHPRFYIADAFKPQLDYEVHMGYLKPTDRARILTFIYEAPVGEPMERDEELGEGALAECVKNLEVLV